MHVLLIGIWITVSAYNTNPTVIILVGIGILPKCMLIFDIWMTVSDHNTSPTVIILVGTRNLTKCIFYLLVSG